MRICAAWLLTHVASERDRSLRKAISFFARAVRLDPNFALAWARLSRAHASLHFGPVATSLSLGGMRLKERWRTRRNSSRTRPKPCSLWVIISITSCVTTGLPKPRSDSSAECCQAAVRSLLPLPLLPDARDTGMKVLPTCEQALALDPRNAELLNKRHGLTPGFDNSRQH